MNLFFALYYSHLNTLFSNPLEIENERVDRESYYHIYYNYFNQMKCKTE